MSHSGQESSLRRADKRRKVFRKRHIDNDDEDRARAGLAALSDSEGTGTEAKPVVRRPASRKQGVVFSTTARQVESSSNDQTEMSLVPISVESLQAEETAQNDRFTKPTGRAEVVEDKHLAAYVESKMAELRSTMAVTTPHTPLDTTLGSVSESMVAELAHVRDGEAGTRPEVTIKSSSELRMAGQPLGRNRKSRPRRQPQARDEGSIARDAMVDEILQESEMPHYDRKTTAAPTTTDPSVDADEAAAQAFKEQFLANLAARTRRRPPTPAPSSRVAKTSQGPKLGGSRAQREKMRALKESEPAAKK